MNFIPDQARNNFRWIKFSFLFLLPILSVACKPLVIFEQPSLTSDITLANGDTVGQTFVARFDGLTGIAIYVSPNDTSSGSIRMTLSKGVEQSDEPIRISQIILNEEAEPDFYRFFLEELTNSSDEYYYAKFEYIGEGTISIGLGPGDTYFNGGFYTNNTSTESQSVFQLIFNRPIVFKGIGEEFIRGLPGFIAAVLAFIFPGWVLLMFILPGWAELHWSTRLGLSAGTSIPFYPLLFLAADVLHWYPGGWLAWLPILCAVLIMLGELIRGLIQRKSQLKRIQFASISQLLGKEKLLSELVLLFVITLTVVTRWWIARGVMIPLFGDSYQHSLITQLLIDHRGLFTSWMPYTPLSTFTYHFGFHSVAAVYHWITGIPAPQAVLWTGQILNVLAILALVPLAMRIINSPWSAAGTILISGLLCTFPNYYVNWGRYTQLAGQVILPVFAVMLWMFLELEQKNWRLIILSGILLAGLGLTHYRITIMAILLLMIGWIPFNDSKKNLSLIIKSVLPGIIAAILFLPWFIRVMGGRTFTLFLTHLSTPADQVPAGVLATNELGDLSYSLPPLIWISALVVTIWGLIRRERGICLIALWFTIILLAANPKWLGLPGTGILNNFSVLIAAYFPAGILIGAGIGWVSTSISKMNKLPWRYIMHSTLILLILALALIGGGKRARELDTFSFELVTMPDIMASRWIQAHTPADAFFLVNSFFAFGENLTVGSDAGWWLPLLAKRSTTLPPINYSFEKGLFPDYLFWVKALASELQEKGIDHPDVIKMLDQRGITYVYLGQRQGSVNNPGLHLDPKLLANNPNFQIVYHQDRVWIFKRVEQ